MIQLLLRGLIYIYVEPNSSTGLIKFQVLSLLNMASWKKTITSPFKKACTFFNQQPPRDHHNKKSQLTEQENRVMDLQGEVMACGYEDVQVMWSILDKSKSTACNITSS